MNTDDGQTKTSRIEQQQQQQLTMAASAVGGGHHRRERTNRQQHTSINTGGNNYKKERFETEKRKPSFNTYDPMSKATMTMSNNNKMMSTAALSGHLHPPAVCLVPQSTLPDSKGPTSATTTVESATKDNRMTTTTRTTVMKTTTTTTDAKAPTAPFLDHTQATTPSTSTSLHSNTAVRLVPRDFGSKGTNDKLKAGKEKQKREARRLTAAQANERWRQHYGDTMTQTTTTTTGTKMTAAEANLRWTQHYGDTTAGKTPATNTVETMTKDRRESERFEWQWRDSNKDNTMTAMAQGTIAQELLKSMQELLQNSQKRWQALERLEGSGHGEDSKVVFASEKSNYGNFKIMAKDSYGKESAKKSMQDCLQEANQRWQQTYTSEASIDTKKGQLATKIARTSLEAERHRQAMTSRDTRKQSESYVREMQVSADIKRVKEEAISTNPSAISKTAVRLVPQSLGSKGIMENNQAGNELEEERQPSLDTSFGDEGNTNQPPTDPHAPGNNRGPTFHPQYMVTATQRKAYRKQTLVVRPLLVKEPTNTQSAQDSSQTKAAPTYFWTQQARGVRASYTSKSSYLLPLPWQHHSWIAPAHRKTLRQQPF
jgi:hypothetical protein